PPLRERADDVPLIVQHLVRKFAARIGVHIESVAKTTMERLTLYTWPGNVRELENILERAVILSNGSILEIDEKVFASSMESLHPTADATKPQSRGRVDELAGATPSQPLESLESSTRSHILAALEKSHWVIDGPRGAAKILALRPNTLRSRMKKLGIVRAANER